MPPFKRKTLILIGVSGVGRRTLKNRIINSDPEKFGTIIPRKLSSSGIDVNNNFYIDNLLFASDTSRPPRVLEEHGKGYWFMDREEMDQQIKENKFLEFGEHNDNLYGTHLDSIRDVIKQGN